MSNIPLIGDSCPINDCGRVSEYLVKIGDSKSLIVVCKQHYRGLGISKKKVELIGYRVGGRI